MKRIGGIIFTLALLTVVSFAAVDSVHASSTITFSSIADSTGNPITLGSESHVQAGDSGGVIQADEALFQGRSESGFGGPYWYGYAVSNRSATSGGPFLAQGDYYTVVGGVDHTATGDNQYAVAKADTNTEVGAAMFVLSPGSNGEFTGAWFNNVDPVYQSMLTDFNETSYYHLIVTAYDSNLNSIDSGMVDLTLVDDWTYQEFGWTDVYAVGIAIDTNAFIYNYFAMDDINVAPVPVPAGVWLLGSGLAGILSLRRKLSK